MESLIMIVLGAVFLGVFIFIESEKSKCGENDSCVDKRVVYLLLLFVLPYYMYESYGVMSALLENIFGGK